jgi:hypothetical protein
MLQERKSVNRFGTIRNRFELSVWERSFGTPSYKPRLLGGMLVAVGGRAKQRMEEKDLAAAI